jgi:hypothetical protein
MDPLTSSQATIVRVPEMAWLCHWRLSWSCSAMAASGSADPGNHFNMLPVKGMVTMIDLGAKKVHSLQNDGAHHGKNGENVMLAKRPSCFIDVWENPESGQPISASGRIPTQIFYDADGREVITPCRLHVRKRVS